MSKFSWLGWFFLSLVMIFPLLGVVCNFIDELRFKTSAKAVVGDVIDFDDHDLTDREGNTAYAPIICYEVAGKLYRQKVRLLYTPAKPEDFKIDTPFQLYFTSIVLPFSALSASLDSFSLIPT